MSAEDRSFWIDGLQSRDPEQERALAGREERFSVLLSLLRTVAGEKPPLVLDLAWRLRLDHHPGPAAVPIIQGRGVRCGPGPAVDI
jgi:hypothetical protein